ncbi:tetratricopeptide repeat protein [bacterium]|nr:tetratricopeptide repeat protein [bacterium]
MYFIRIKYLGWIFFLGILTSCSHQSVQLTSGHTSPSHDSRAIELFVDGLNHELNQNYPAALLMYQEALLYDSTSAVIYLNIGKNYFRLGKEESAILALKRCVELDPNNMEAWDILASVYARQGWWDLVEKTYLSMMKRDSTDEKTLHKLALLYLQSNQKEKAAGVYQRLLRIQSVPDPKIYIALGEIYFDLKRFDDAGQIFHGLITINPESGFGYFGLGMTREVIQDTAGAIGFYKEAVDKTPELNEARDRLGQIYIAKKDWPKAIRLYTNAIQIDTTDLESWLELGDLYQQTGDSLQATHVYQEIQQRFTEEWQAHFNYGRFLMRKQAYDSALTAFKKVHRLSPDNALGWLFSGIVYTNLDSLEGAERDLLKALAIESKDPLGNYYLGTVYIRLKMYDKAIIYLKHALALRPEWISALSDLANAYESLESYIQADSVFQYALNIEPDHALLLNNYAYSLALRKERLDEALFMAQRALGQEPENGAYLDTVGWIYFMMNEPQQALEYMKKAVAVRQNSYEVFDHLGDVYAALNMIDEAREAWGQALRLDASNLEIQKKLGQLEDWKSNDQ